MMRTYCAVEQGGAGNMQFAAGLVPRCTMEADSACLAARMVAMSVQIHTPGVPFSRVSPSAASDAAVALAVDPDPAGLVPFQWQGVSELQASHRLVQLLRTWVTTDAPPLHIPNMFFDVQPLPWLAPMLRPVDGVANFSGMPDMVVVRDTMLREAEAMPISSTSVVAVEWKSSPENGIRAPDRSNWACAGACFCMIARFSHRAARVYD